MRTNKSLCFGLLVVILVVIGCSKPQEKMTTIQILNNKFSWEKKGSCDIIVTQNDIITHLNAKGKYRGGMSSKYPKHSYTIDLHEDFEFFPFPKGDDWIFNAGYVDKTFMRHKISYDLYRKMNVKNRATKVSYFNLILESDNRGLFMLMQKINASFLNLDKSDTLAMLFKGPPFLYKEKLKAVQDSMNYYHQKFPKKRKSDKTYYIESFKSFLFNSSDSDFIKDINNWIDVENVIDWHLLLMFSYNGDGIMKNFYLYKKNAQTPFRIAIWDYDHSFGRDGDGEYNMMERAPKFNKSVLFRRLMEIDETGYKIKLKERWKELRSQNIFSKEIFDKMIEQNEKLFKNELINNFNRWPVNSTQYYDSNTYEQEIQIMKDFVTLRLPFLDNYFEDLK